MKAGMPIAAPAMAALEARTNDPRDRRDDDTLVSPLKKRESDESLGCGAGASFTKGGNIFPGKGVSCQNFARNAIERAMLSARLPR